MRKNTTKIAVKDEPSLERDSSSNAILNRDAHGYAMAVARKMENDQKEKRIVSLEEEIASLKELVSQILQNAKA